MDGYREFEFDLPGALLANLVILLDGLAAVPLTSAATALIPDEQGVYQLFLDAKPVYVGKTDAGAGLRSRLGRHSRKILHRHGLDPTRVTYKAIRIFVFTAVDLETDLIKHYGNGDGLAWNKSGFGSNDPGRNRDDTKSAPKNYDYMFPIDIDIALPGDIDGGSARSVLSTLNARLPYTFRFDKRALPEIEVDLLQAPYTARQVLEHVVSRMPAGWQATKLLGYIILYKENKSYPDGEVVARS